MPEPLQKWTSRRNYQIASNRIFCQFVEVTWNSRNLLTTTFFLTTGSSEDDLESSELSSSSSSYLPLCFALCLFSFSRLAAGTYSAKSNTERCNLMTSYDLRKWNCLFVKKFEPFTPSSKTPIAASVHRALHITSIFQYYNNIHIPQSHFHKLQ